MKLIHRNLILVFTFSSLIFGQIPYTSDAKNNSKSKDEFTKRDISIEKLHLEIQELKKDLKSFRNEINMPVIREEIKNSIKIPEMKYEITLNNNSIVQGDIIKENIDKIIFQTRIRKMTLDRKLIKNIKKLEEAVPVLDIKGSIDEQTFTDKKIYSGRIENSGDKHADFVRIVFYLFNDDTELINIDSSFVMGNESCFSTGIYSMSTITSGGNGIFQCEVKTKNVPVSYYTSKILYNSYE
ncbi:MAG: hypothetical protein KAI81_07995 [Candidatus Marinimicrobia bacterium]|nr:hypothetical protein [Candidatus Neomarinimicrobiota bacterium]